MLRIPTLSEAQALVNATKNGGKLTVTSIENGVKVANKTTGHYITFTGLGYMYTDNQQTGSCRCWTSTRVSDSYRAYFFLMKEGTGSDYGYSSRAYGYPIRAVVDKTLPKQ